MKSLYRVVGLNWLVAGLLALSVAPVWRSLAQESPGELRERAGKLKQKAADLKADGKVEEAKKAIEEIEELVSKAERIEKEKGGPRPEPMERRVALKRELEESLAQLKKVRETGNEQEAREVKDRIAALQSKLEAERPPAEADRGRGARPERPDAPAFRRGPGFAGPGLRPRPGAGRRPLAGDQPGPETRREHLRQAIEHLHAAGLHVPAERLARLGERLGPGPRPGGPAFGPGPRGPGGDPAQVREELQELRRMVRELHARLDDRGRGRP